jgi:hypothetical protein
MVKFQKNMNMEKKVKSTKKTISRRIIPRNSYCPKRKTKDKQNEGIRFLRRPRFSDFLHYGIFKISSEIIAKCSPSCGEQLDESIFSLDFDLAG